MFLPKPILFVPLLAFAAPLTAQPNWTQAKPALSPSKRSGHAMCYDAGRSRIVLFGGNASLSPHGSLADTWEWDGTKWIPVFWLKRYPPARSGHALVYDVVRGRSVLFGGYNKTRGALSDTWVYNAKAWTQLQPGTAPRAR